MLLFVDKNAQRCNRRHMIVTDIPVHSTKQCLKVSEILARIGNKWTVLIIMMLRERTHRFNELKRGIDGISQRMLTLTLRNMERDGLIGRTVTPSIPPRVDYALTPLGHSLAEPVQALGDWSFSNLGEIEAARQLFDERLAG